MYELPKYKCIHQVRSYGKGGGVSIYIHNSLNFKLRLDLSINSFDVESLSIELLCKKKKNTLISVLYRPPKGLLEPLDKFFNEIFNKTKKSNKNFHISGDFNLNVLDHDNCKKIQSFLNLLYQNSMISIISKPTRVTRKSATAIDHIITNCFAESNFKTAIFKSDISDHFPIGAFFSTTAEQTNNGVTYIYKRIINNEAIQRFNQKLYELNWNKLKNCEDPSESY